MKKGAIPIYLLVSIVITIVGISLVFVFIGNNTDGGKKFYCDSFYDQNRKIDPFCEKYLSIKKGLSRSTSVLETRFTTKRTEEFLNVSSDVSYTVQKSVRLPVNANITNAKVTVSLAQQYLSLFEEGTHKEVMIVPANRPWISKNTADIPANANITSARMEIYGAEYPSEANIVFLIDTSDSLADEWAALCNILLSLNKSMDKMGLNVTVDIFGLGDGETFGKCLTGWVTPADIDSIMPLTEVEAYSGDWPPYPSYDDYAEAWALGSAWLADNYPWKYKTDVKRAIISISDSDPTGGGPTNFNDDGWTNDGQFSGNEQIAIYDAITNAVFTGDPATNHVYLIPIPAEEGGDAERFGIGGDCNIGSKCASIISWMHEFIDETGAGVPVSGFKNMNQLLNKILAVVVTNFPKDIELAVRGEGIATDPTVDDIIWTFPLELNSSNSPAIVNPIRFQEIVEDQCVGQKCEISVRSENGTVIFDRLKIDYVQNPMLQTMIVGTMTLTEVQDINFDNPFVEVDITEALNRAIGDSTICPQDQRFCDVPIKLIGTQEGAVLLEGLNIDYSYYNLEEEIITKIIDCWKQTDKGVHKKDYLCAEISVPDFYNYKYPISEMMITKILRSRNFCHIIGNTDVDGTPMNCGDEDNIDFAQDIYKTQNILIEYDGDASKIIVS